MTEFSWFAMLQLFIVLFTAASGAASLFGGLLAWKGRGVMSVLTGRRDAQQASQAHLHTLTEGQRQGNETLRQIHTHLTTLVERLAPPPKEDR